ncbi:MAG: hypothetical protein HY290_32460 [Planctomycetia bacterium]|nr:hypothetical protein [Planctomycetia bacterium]
MNVQLAVKSAGPIACFLAAVCCLPAMANGQDSHDVVFKTEYSDEELPETGRFYFNERAIGEGREAFQEIVKRVRSLPDGTSIVWGPNYARCGSCADFHLDLVPKRLYPDLWKELEKTAADRHLTISSIYPGPFVQFNPHRPHVEFPTEIVAARAREDARFDATLDWEVGEKSSDLRNPAGTDFCRGRLHRFKANKRNLAGYDREFFLDRLQDNSSLLVRVTLRADQKSAPVAEVVPVIAEGLDTFVGRHARLGNFKTTIVVPASFAPLLKQRPDDDLEKEFRGDLLITWKNYHGPDTPHEEVLYYANGTYLGRGDVGIDRLLEKIDELPAGARVSMLRYELRGRAALENFSKEERESRNARLKELVPFGKRKVKLDARIAAKKLKTGYWEVDPGEDSGTVLSWKMGGEGTDDFVSKGRIIRHDEQPKRPSARLGWVRYDAHETGPTRKLESTAVYTLDDAEVGQGVIGFERALQRIEALPEGSVVQVRVCLRTKGPFLCPLIYQGLRHFERSGYEPYFELLELFLDVAQRRKFKIEWLPDEGESCGDCELNR